MRQKKKILTLVKITDMIKLANDVAKDGSLVTKPELAAVKNKISDVSGLVKKTDCNSKITEIESKISIISRLVTNSGLTAVENAIHNVSGLLKKTDYNTKISEIETKITDHNHEKYITTSEFNNLAEGVFTARLPQANVVTKTDFDAKLQELNKKINSNKTKHLLVENEFKKLEKFDAAYFWGKNYFDGDGTQNCLVF